MSHRELIDIRSASIGQLRAIAELACDFSKEIAPNRRSKLSVEDYWLALRSVQSTPNSLFCAVKADMEIAGFMALDRRLSVISGGLYIELSDLFVVEAYRGIGLGSRFIEQAKVVCASEEIDRLALSTGVEDLSASPNDLYIRHGFEYVGPTLRCLL